MNREVYLLHQTPADCAKDLLQFIPLQPQDKVIEPFKGEGAFFNAFPDFVEKEWAEKEQGKDYTDISGVYDWVITNPPYRVETGTRRINSFWYLLDYYSQRAEKGIAFLSNDKCFQVLTPKRMMLLRQRGWSITKIVVCSVKKWRGRYFFLILEKNKPGILDFLSTNY
jgi:type I restriction-modification system DNA methylase subunit